MFVDPKGPDVTDEWISALESLTGTEADDAAELLAGEVGFRDDPTSNDEHLVVQGGSSAVV